MTELAIVGNFYDGNYDLWEDFLELKEHYWKNCPYPTYIVSKEQGLNFSKHYDATIIKAGKEAEFSRRIQKALESVDADYFLLLLDDYYFGVPLDGSVLDEIVSLMRTNNIFYYCMPANEFIRDFRGSSFNGMKSVQNFSGSSEYTLTCQPAIWNTKFLKKCIGEGNYTPWVFEGIYVRSKMAHSDEFLSHCKVDISNLLGLRHVALQGKIIPPTIDYFRERGYEMKSRRSMMDRSDYKKYESKAIINALLPYWLRKALRNIFKKRSVIDNFQKEINTEMLRMNIY